MANEPDLEMRLGEVPLEAFMERTSADVADKIRFLYTQVQYRQAIRDKTVESLLWLECYIDNRLGEIERHYGWFNETGEKERIHLADELRNLRKERQRAYESFFGYILKVKTDLVDALLEYRALRRRGKLFGEPEKHEYLFPLLPQYFVPYAPQSLPYERRRP